MTQLEALRAIAERQPAAITDIPASRNTVYALRDKRLLRRAGVRHTGQRGRPAKLYELSKRGLTKLERAAV
jgi:hypothetical protein